MLFQVPVYLKYWDLKQFIELHVSFIVFSDVSFNLTCAQNYDISTSVA